MDITLAELLRGKGTKIKDKEYYPTEAYIEPFLNRIDKIQGVEYKVAVELPKQITITKKEDVNFDDVTYNRVWIQAILPEEYNVDNHQDVIGMVYGLDVRKPIVKIFRGGINQACTNLCVFNPDYLRVQELAATKAINYTPLDELIEKSNEIHVFLQKLHSTVLDCSEESINESLGRWIRNCLDYSYDNGLSKAKLSTATAIDAYKLLFKDAKSPYYVNSGQNTDMFNVYNAFTELISNKDKDIINKCEKTLALRTILSI